MSEKNKTLPRITAGGLIVLGMAGLTGCNTPPPNYSGEGNHFRVSGVISDTGRHDVIQIHEDDVVVESAEGIAQTWFDERRGQGLFSEEFDFHDSYKQESGGWNLCGEDISVGEIHDVTGNEIEFATLQPGDVVEIQGSIRDTRYWQSAGRSGYCTTEERAVYDIVILE